MKIDQNKFWRYFAVGYLTVNTVSAIILLEVLVTGNSQISSFLLILIFTIYLNQTVFKK